jgi:ferredoxin, 2Fe-2S
MPKITFIDHQGNKKVIDIPSGGSLMEAADGEGVPGILADCGGAMACATCHVYVDDNWYDKLPKITEDEQGMIDSLSINPNEKSRLSCQIEVTDELDGFIVTTPEKQVDI